ncbi:hypothetical protein M407DRAFT_19306 [Tulasnella calospora MUT 4182]|uniref:DUF6535 domain-containing protein n=1 Tax=Tulasnella calospora MUT 4182 TaxID=1051891 RepID=A0A0C3MDF1_9AGAM|nr:hypothetical protein M407DRAFT_19306 [Tulasnella calospora MUT 4182]
MATATQNTRNTPELKVPTPPDKFGQDGNFYRCYDALAEEIDEDMTKRLKEQLDTMLVFNNILLMQLVTGRNDTIPVDSTLPSAAFFPSSNIFSINVLFILSLGFTIFSAFLAVIGRQCLVNYRKRSGRSDLQRWEHLKRFLGAERWQLENLLDNSVPLLLQFGLIIFFLSLVLYTHYLSPALCIDFGVVLSMALVFVTAMALCRSWDEFCPFDSTISRLLIGMASSVVAPVKLVVPFRIAFFDGGRWKRDGGSEPLQAILLQRAICRSDDPETLLHAIANIITIGDPDTINQLWANSAFQRRFCELNLNLSETASRLVGYIGSPRELAESAGQLCHGAAAHILLTIRPDPQTSDALLSRYYTGLLLDIASFSASKILMPSPPLGNPSSNWIRSNLGLFAIWCLYHGDDEVQIGAIGNHLVACSEVLARFSDCQLLLFFSWIVCWFASPYSPRFESVQRIREASRTIDLPSQSLEIIGEAYQGNAADVTRTVQDAFQALLRTESRGLLDCDAVLTNMLQSIERVLADEQDNPNANVQRAFQLLEGCEEALRSPRLPLATRQIGEKLRMSVTELWRRKYRARRVRNASVDELMMTLQSYLTYLRSLKRTESGYDEDIGFERVFGAMLRPISADVRLSDEGQAVCEMFDAFVGEVSEHIRKTARRIRGPDEHWCHWEEEPLLIKGTRGSFVVNRGI